MAQQIEPGSILITGASPHSCTYKGQGGRGAKHTTPFVILSTVTPGPWEVERVREVRPTNLVYLPVPTDREFSAEYLAQSLNEY